MNKLGLLYFDAEKARLLGLVRSAKRAIKLWENAVELGDTTALYNLGNCCANGDGVKLNLKKAMNFYRMASDRGDPVSQNALGVRLFAQDNFEEAFRYFHLSAEQGFTKAELNIGQCFQDGKGVEANLEEAKQWYVRAADKGNEDAKHMLAAMRAPLDFGVQPSRT
jgi:TPR repeat protein